MNKVVHFEIPVKNYDRAKNFYTKMFDWKIEEWPGTKSKYGMAITTPTDQNGPKEPGGINGAIMEPTEKFERVSMLTIEVPSIDDYLSRISASGGKTLMVKKPVGDMGFMARFEDPEGNVVGLWETVHK
jgi:uncharacterized protein